MNFTTRENVLAVVRKLGGVRCAYSAPGRGWSRYCDCKYGGEHAAEPWAGERGNGCPELRCVVALLERLTDAEWETITRREGSRD